MRRLDRDVRLNRLRSTTADKFSRICLMISTGQLPSDDTMLTSTFLQKETGQISPLEGGEFSEFLSGRVGGWRARLISNMSVT